MKLGITLNFVNGTSFEAEYVIGADGVRLALRRALYGADNTPHGTPNGVAVATQRQRYTAGGA